ncbi:hypothetical protein [Achromobacter sp.]|uniref:hypothetical protein n=1 Tax=Achromobacter sp. TaxID=134375 RepID=UPI000ECD6350|nr:hypothetical protein [Achromobacter sp.]HCW19192.1 hypothetical protein [Achromobacter sp.]
MTDQDKTALLSKLRAEGVQAGDERHPEHIETLQRMRADYSPSDGPMSELKATALDAAIAALANTSIAVPENWKLVPLKPTPKMIGAWYDAFNANIKSAARSTMAYQALIDAAPDALASAPVAGEALGWRVRERRSNDGKLLDCFVEAPAAPGMAYAQEVLGDDYAEAQGGIEGKLKHCQMIVAWANAAPQASEAVRNAVIEETVSEFVRRGFPSDWAEIVKMALKTQADKDGAVCSCPSGDGSLRHPCAVHPPGDKDGGDCAKGAGETYRDSEHFHKTASIAELGAWQRGWDDCRDFDDKQRSALAAQKQGDSDE